MPYAMRTQAGAMRPLHASPADTHTATTPSSSTLAGRTHPLHTHCTHSHRLQQSTTCSVTRAPSIHGRTHVPHRVTSSGLLQCICTGLPHHACARAHGLAVTCMQIMHTHVHTHSCTTHIHVPHTLAAGSTTRKRHVAQQLHAPKPVRRASSPNILIGPVMQHTSCMHN